MTASPRVAEKLRSDANAAVRFIAWQRWQKERLWIASDVIYDQNEIPPVLQTSAAALLADRSPILRSLGPWCMFFGLEWASRNAAKVPAAARAIAEGKDPWLKLGVDASSPLLEGIAACLTDSRKLDPPAAMAGIVALLTSGKPSHEALGVACVVAGKCALLQQSPGFEKVLKLDASPVAALGESNHLWARIAGIAANGLIDADGARGRIASALQSESEIDRLAGLLACTMLSLNERTPPPTPQMEAAMIACFRSPAYAESALAAQAVGRSMAIQKVLPILRDHVRNKPRLPRTLILLEAAIGPGWQRAPFPARQEIGSIVLESSDPGLQIFYLQKDDLWTFDPALLAQVIRRCRPEVLAWMLSDFRVNTRLKASEWRPALTERIVSMAGHAAAATRAIAARAMASYASVSSGSLDKENKRQLLQAAARVLAPCFDKGANADHVAAGFELIAALLSDHGPFGWPDDLGWLELPAAGRDAVARALSWANEAPHSQRAADLLASLFRWNQGRKALAADPQLKKAAEDARLLITVDGTSEDQVRLLCGTGGKPQDSAELQKRFLAGGLSPELQLLVVQSLRSDKLTPDCIQAMTMIVCDANAGLQLRLAAADRLQNCPDAFEQLLDALTWLAKNERSAGFNFCVPLQGVWMNREAAKLRGEANPPWLRKAAALGLMAARDSTALPVQRSAGLHIYTSAVGTAAENVIIETMLDPELDPRVRQGAWRAFAGLSGQTDIYARVAKRYKDVGWLMQIVVAEAAAALPQAQGTDAFIVHFLKDPTHDADRKRDLLGKLQPPPTAALRTALAELGQDAELGPQAKAALKKMEDTK